MVSFSSVFGIKKQAPFQHPGTKSLSALRGTTRLDGENAARLKSLNAGNGARYSAEKPPLACALTGDAEPAVRRRLAPCAARWMRPFAFGLSRSTL